MHFNFHHSRLLGVVLGHVAGVVVALGTNREECECD